MVSCSTTKKLDTSALRLGMSKTLVSVALYNHPLNTLRASYNERGQKVEIVSYSNGVIYDSYLLVFLDDTLVEWTKAIGGRSPDLIIDQTITHKNN